MFNEENAKTLIDEKLRNLSNLLVLTKEYLLHNGKKAEYAILIDDHPIALIETKKSGIDLAGALIQAKV